MAEDIYTNADGSPKWIGGSGNVNYRPTPPGTNQARTPSNQWTSAEKLRLQAIEAQKKGTLQALQRAEQQAGQQFEQGRTTLSGQYQAGKRSLAEFMAQRGQTNSGTSAQGQIQGLNTLGMGLGNLESTRESALSNIALQRAAAEQQALQSQAELAGTAEDRRIAEQEAAQARDLSAIQAGAYNQDVQAEINRRAAINPNDPMIPFLTAQRNQKLAGMATSESEQAQQDFENNLALEKLAISRYSAYKPSGSSSGTSSGMTDAAYQKWAVEQATSGGIFIQSTYDQLMRMRGASSSAQSANPTLDRIVANIQNAPAAYKQIALTNYSSNLTQSEMDYIKAKLGG